ncbi:hypothetical protein H4Q26_003329 [Puccinia striiformis f. sp. tritici PST-130]|nr:hypothetical protein H4Q26_003329 [Puccinia striiformis f. sp. tritici PST-130]
MSLPPSTKKIIAQAAVSISFADVVKPQKGQVFRGNQAFNKPSVSPGDTAQYFKSIREMTKPSPGLSVEHLDDARGSTSPYWSAVHINSLAEDFETMFEDLHKLGDRKYAKGQLTEVAQDLKAVHLNSLQYIERFLERWAAANDVSKRKIFGDKIFSLTKKKTAGQKNELPLGDPELSRGYFPKIVSKEPLRPCLSSATPVTSIPTKTNTSGPFTESSSKRLIKLTNLIC